jgi:glycosyltransferase involved in cell wall biosynthesis
MTRDLSIIIPAYNEARLISHGLASIQQHLAGLDYEVIVVDNGSLDDTGRIAAGFLGVRVLRIEKSTISRARNEGEKLASGRMYAFLDADVMVTPRWAAAMRRKLAQTQGGGDYFGGFPFDIPDQASLLERAWFPASSVGGGLSYVGSANLVVSSSVFRKIEGFNEALRTAEDVDFGHRARRTGQRIDFDPEFHAIHLGFPRTAGHFVKREVWHGLGSFSSWSKFMQSKVSIAAVLFALLLVGALLSLALGHTFTALCMLGLFLVMPLLYVVYRFQLKNSKYLPVQYVLGFLYLGSRAMSGIRSVFKLTATGHRST